MLLRSPVPDHARRAKKKAIFCPKTASFSLSKIRAGLPTGRASSVPRDCLLYGFARRGLVYGFGPDPCSLARRQWPGPGRTASLAPSELGKVYCMVFLGAVYCMVLLGTVYCMVDLRRGLVYGFPRPGLLQKLAEIRLEKAGTQPSVWPAAGTRKTRPRLCRRGTR